MHRFTDKEIRQGLTAHACLEMKKLTMIETHLDSLLSETDKSGRHRIYRNI